MDKNLANIELLLLDVDGVLTDGSIIYSDSGEQIKSFNAKDGLGLRLLMDAGIRAGVITARKSGALRHRLDNLGITLVFEGIMDKSKALATITTQTGLSPSQIAYVGDDLIDLPVLKRVGAPFCVADSPAELTSCGCSVTRNPGGRGAVREVCEKILKAKGLWEQALAKFQP